MTTRLLLFGILLALLTSGEFAGSLRAAAPWVAAFPATQTSQDPAPDPDDFGNPFFILFFLVVIGTCLVLIGVGAVFGVALLVALGVFTTLGILSSSLVVGLIARRTRAGFRFLLAQIAILGCVPGAVAAVWLVSHFGHLHWAIVWIIGSGVVCGVVSGVCLAFILDRIVGFVLGRLKERSG